MLGMNVVSGIIPDNSHGIETNEMVQQPEHFGRTWFLESISSRAGGGFGRAYNHEFFFYNFTVMSNSTASVIFEIKGSYHYSPTLGNMTLAPGESLGGNFTYIGPYGVSGTMFMDFESKLESAGNATVIYEVIIWDTYVYKMGLTGYLTIGGFCIVFIVFVIVFLRSGRGKRSPDL